MYKPNKRVFVCGGSFQPSQVFASKAGAYPSDLSRVQSREGFGPTQNIRLCWKGLLLKNTPAFGDHLKVTKKIKSCEYSATTFSITTLSITTLIIKTLSKTISKLLHSA